MYLASQSPYFFVLPITILEVSGTHSIVHSFWPNFFWLAMSSSLGWCVSPHPLVANFLWTFSEDAHTKGVFLL
jgi:hypothetical protein